MNPLEIKSGADLHALTATGLSLVNFGTPWCAPCRLQEPIVRRIAARYKGRAGIAAANVDEHASLAEQWGIESVPTLLIFREGLEIQRLVGLQSEETLARILSGFLEPEAGPDPLA